MKESPQRRSLPIEGWSVTRIILDGRFILAFYDERDWEKGFELVIETPFSWWIGDDESVASEVDPQDASQDAVVLGKAPSALHQTCTEARATENGVLSLHFENALHLRVQPHEQFEAWNLVALQQPGSNVVALPGGGLSIWE